MAVIKSWACEPLFILLLLLLMLVIECETAPPGGRALPTERPMIARIWHGWTKRADAKAYEEMLRDEIFRTLPRGWK
jgi:hypothetical protein